MKADIASNILPSLELVCNSARQGDGLARPGPWTSRQRHRYGGVREGLTRIVARRRDYSVSLSAIHAVEYYSTTVRSIDQSEYGVIELNGRVVDYVTEWLWEGGEPKSRCGWVEFERRA